MTTNMLVLGRFRYALEQADPDDAGTPSPMMLLRHPGNPDPLASLQRLDTTTPELIVYPWTDESERARLKSWRSTILDHAQHVWRARTGTVITVEQHWRWRCRPFTPAIASTITLTALLLLIVVVPDQTSPLVLAAVGGLIVVGTCLGVVWLLLGVERALQIAWKLAAAAFATWVLVYSWLLLLDHLWGAVS